MAEQEIIALLREQIDTYGAGDNDRMVATVTDDIIYNEIGTGRRVEGSQEWLNIWEEWRQVFPDLKGTIQNIIVSGNQLSAETTWNGTFQGDLASPGGTIPANGKRMEQFPVAFFATVEEGKIKEESLYFDLQSMLQQLGAMPQG